MKIIAKEDLLLLLGYVIKSHLCMDDLKSLLDDFGDEYFIVDGELVRTKENKLMKTYRSEK